MHCTSTPLYTLTVWWLMKHGDTVTSYEVFSCYWVVLPTEQTVMWTNKSWITISSNVLVHRQQWQNVIPVDEESPCGRRVCRTSSGTSVTSDWGRSWGKIAVLSAVVHCSLVDRHHYRLAYCPLIFCPNGRKGFCEISMLSNQVARHYIQEDSDDDGDITSHKIQKVYLCADTSTTKGSNKRVCHVKLQYVFCLQFEKHTITQANVHRYALPCVVADTNLWTWCPLKVSTQVVCGEVGGVVCRDEGNGKTCRHVSQAPLSQRDKRCFPWPVLT